MGTLDSANRNGPTDNVTDVSGVSSRQRKRRRLLYFGLAGMVAACLWVTYVWYGKPKLDEHRLDLALAALSTSSEQGLGQSAVESLKAKPREKMLLDTFEVLSSPIKNIDDQVRLSGARAALDIAVSEGSGEARLLLGKAFRDGIFGQKDSIAALREFEKVSSTVESGVKAGDSSALYVYALMLSEGLGVAPDRRAAVALMTRAVDGLDGWRLKGLGFDAVNGFAVFKNEKAPELASRIARRLVAAGDPSAYLIGVASCNVFHEIKLEPKDRNLEQLSETIERKKACSDPWVKDAALAGYKPAMSTYADTLLFEYGNVKTASQWYEAAGSERSNTDNFHYGALKAIAATDAEEVVSAIRGMWAALKAEKKSEYQNIGTSASEIFLLNSRMRKALAKDFNYSRTYFAMVLLTLGKLEDSVPQVMAAAQMGVGMNYLIPLVKSPRIDQAASLTAEAVRQNKTYAEVAAAEAAKKAVPFWRSDALASAVPPRTFSYQDAIKPAPQRNSPDPEQQAKTGYLAGEPSATSGGLSTFTVDNSTGERDAVVRLYIGGKKPAARSVYIKLGEKFTSRYLMPGTYTMRYRFIGNTDTFEAEDPFVLNESKTETGRRFSNVTVTLYKVRDGNMKSKKVSADEF